MRKRNLIYTGGSGPGDVDLDELPTKAVVKPRMVKPVTGPYTERKPGQHLTGNQAVKQSTGYPFWVIIIALLGLFVLISCVCGLVSNLLLV